MDFCKECGSRLEPKKVKSGKQVLLVLACVKCGEKTKEPKEIKITGKAIMHNPKQMVSVIDKTNQLSVLPTIQMCMPKMRKPHCSRLASPDKGADESSTQFLRCTNCEYTFREST
jgi:DNA-directed RNA polymerase subunit M